MIASLPPAIRRPSGYFFVGRAKATALTKPVCKEETEQSYLGGCCDSSFHCRTVASLEAENIRSGEATATARTYRKSVWSRSGNKWSMRPYVVSMLLERSG